MITQMAYLIKAIFLLSTSHQRYVVQYGESLVLFFIIRYLFPLIPQSLMQKIVCLCVFVCLCLFVCVCLLVCVRKCTYASARIFSVRVSRPCLAAIAITLVSIFSFQQSLQHSFQTPCIPEFSPLVDEAIFARSDWLHKLEIAKQNERARE